MIEAKLVFLLQHILLTANVNLKGLSFDPSTNTFKVYHSGSIDATLQNILLSLVQYFNNTYTIQYIAV